MLNHLENQANNSEQLEEIHNIEKAMRFIDDNLQVGDQISFALKQ
ncbi:MAG: hypothetical protein SOW21_12025 [[Actinobacillus] rossii]|nr:hypothetical protein [[Actinobacillus] rossii]MDY3125059.1 hypothetical protein [[Actinobacillus] rossii]